VSTLPVPTRTWTTYDAAVSVPAQSPDIGATNKRLLRLMFSTARTNGLLTLDYGCNSVTAGTKGDLVDRITSDSNVVGANAGTAHSWWVDTVLAGPAQICFDRNGTFEGSGSCWFSPSAGFTGGSTTNRPTATDETEISLGTGNVLSTTQGDHVVEMVKCTTPGQQAIRMSITNSNVAAGPVALISIERPAGSPAAHANPWLCRWNGGAGTFGNRSDYTSSGWKYYTGSAWKTVTLVGLTPQSGTDPDGDRLLDGGRFTESAGVGDVGYVDDWWWQDDAINALMGYSSPAGARRWQAYDEAVWPHGGGDRGGGNTAGAKLRVVQQPAVVTADTTPPVVTMITPVGAQTNRQIDLHFTVTDVAPGLLTVPIYIRFGQQVGEQVLFRRGLFRAPWVGTVTAITSGFDFVVKAPPFGWPPGSVTIILDPVDSAGNMVAA